MVPVRTWLAAGLACVGPWGLASGQPRPLLSCTTAASPGPVYAGGIAESLADIVLTCDANGGAGPSAAPDVRVDVSVTLNVSVSNAVGAGGDGELSDAVLSVNDNDCDAPSTSGSSFGVCDAPRADVQDPQFGRLASPTTLEWLDVTLPPSAARATLRIRGIRGNASQLRLVAGTGQPSPPVTATVSVRSDTAVAVRNSVVRLGFPIPGVAVEVAEASSSAACLGDLRGRASIRLKEGFTHAFTAVPAKRSGSASTRILLDFHDVPDDVSVSLSPAVGCHQPDHDGSDADGRDRATLGLVSGHGRDGTGGVAGHGPLESPPTVAVALDHGFGRAVYEVQSDDPTRVEDCHVPVRLESESDRVSSARVSVRAGLGPLGAAYVSSEDAPVPRFAAPPLSSAVDIDLAACGTTLLFPFVTNQAGFSTSLLITHGSRQALTSSSPGRAASCDLHYYGSTSEGRGVLLVQHSTAIDPGEQLSFNLAAGNLEQNIVGTEQFQGYIMAVCGYPDARGYAFISDGFGDIPDLAMGYLAPVVPLGPGGRRLPMGEGQP